MRLDKKQNALLYGEDAVPDTILNIQLTKRPAPFDRLVKVSTCMDKSWGDLSEGAAFRAHCGLTGQRLPRALMTCMAATLHEY